MMKLKKINLKNNDPKNDSSQIRLICQTRDLGHETKITPLKKNRYKLWSLIFKQSNVEGWNKKNTKNDLKS
jgi:hypothetical protein